MLNMDVDDTLIEKLCCIPALIILIRNDGVYSDYSVSYSFICYKNNRYSCLSYYWLIVPINELASRQFGKPTFLNL